MQVEDNPFTFWWSNIVESLQFQLFLVGLPLVHSANNEANQQRTKTNDNTKNVIPRYTGWTKTPVRAQKSKELCINHFRSNTFPSTSFCIPKFRKAWIKQYHIKVDLIDSEWMHTENIYTVWRADFFFRVPACMCCPQPLSHSQLNRSNSILSYG